MGVPLADFLRMQCRLKTKDLSISGPLKGDPVSRESKLHDQIMEECRTRRWLVIHSRMDMPATVAKGVPDFVIMADKGRLLLVECKSKTGKLTIEQMAFGIMAEELGHKVHVVRSLEEFREAAKI